jgi:hypothetical protein
MTRIQMCPRILLYKQDGPELVAALADLLEAEQRGFYARRVPGLLPEGTPQAVAKAARKALLILACGQQSGRLSAADETGLAFAIKGYRDRIDALQREWRALLDEPETTQTMALERIREAHRMELSDYPTEKALRGLLQGDALAAACRLAARKCPISAKRLRRIFRKSKFAW